MFHQASKRTLFRRTSVILWYIVPMILSFMRDFRRYLFWGSGRTLTDEQHLCRAKRLTHILGYLGPTFIKVAQVLSARADIFTKVYLAELATLQDRVEPSPTDAIRNIISTDLQQRVERIFDEFDDQPLAAASLGQVHRAIYQGEQVVVKVLRPGVPELVQTDLIILHGIFRVLNTFWRDNAFLHSLTTALNEFQRVILREMDFRLEAQNVTIFQRNFAGDEYVVIPGLYDELTTKNVIVLEYLKGVKISDVTAIEEMGVDVTLILQHLARIYVQQFLVDGILHADPHPGNVFVNERGQLILLDFGMVVPISDHLKTHFIKASVAVANMDLDGVVHELYELGVVEPGTNKALLRDFAELLLEIQEKGKLEARRAQKLNAMILEAFHEFPFTLPAELVYIGRAASLIEGIGFIHDPWYDVFAAGKPVVKELMQGKLKDTLQKDVVEGVQQFAVRSYQTVSALQDIILRADREQMRVRLHPTDLYTLSAIMSGMTRRVMAAMCAAALGIVAAIIYFQNGSALLLTTGLFSSGTWFMILLLLPAKKLDSGRRRAVQSPIAMIATDDGEVYKSWIIAQMTPEERAKAEARREKAESRKQREEEEEKEC